MKISLNQIQRSHSKIAKKNINNRILSFLVLSPHFLNVHCKRHMQFARKKFFRSSKVKFRVSHVKFHDAFHRVKNILN